MMLRGIERGWMLVRGERKRGGGSERRWMLVSTGMTTSSSLLAVTSTMNCFHGMK